VALRGVLLDSGDVLMGPRGGRWWPRPGFVETLAAERPDADLSGFDAAHDVALAWYFGVRPGPMDAAEGLALERRYFRRILQGMDIEPTEDLLDALFRGDGLPLVEFSADARPLLEQLRARDLRLALVSDATPALRDFYAEAGLDGFFETMVISAELGCAKPDPRMYTTAIEALGLDPAELIFLDNDVSNVQGAIAAGIEGVVLDVHGSGADAGDLPVVGSLPDFLALVDERLAGVWVDRRVAVRRSPIEGDGLFASAAIAEGTVVIRLGGRLVTSAALAELIDAATTYVDTITVDEDAHLVLPPGTAAHFGNHSCDPDLWLVGPYELATRRPIAVGDEITLDYATVSGADGFAMDCHCGSARCRGRITSDDWRRPDLRRRYEGHWAPALQRRIDGDQSREGRTS
jgi:hypothetical protein